MKSVVRRLFGLFILLAVVVAMLGMDTNVSTALRGRAAGMPAEEAYFASALPSAALQLDEADRGPFVTRSTPYVWNGDLRDLPQLDTFYPRMEMPRPGVPKTGLEAFENVVDPMVQTSQGLGQMPDPIANFDGVHYAEYGGWHPPDTNGDVGPNHYIETINIGIGIFDKASGTRLVGISFDDFFTGPPGSQCDDAGENSGDPIVNYDPIADRWIISDFALNVGSHQCFAVSQTGDPVSGGWYFYDIDTEDPDSHSWCDYPKVGVWPDAYYMTCNMFTPWVGANVFALDRAAMLSGQPATAIMFRAGSAYGSLLPANLRGDLPPAGAPNYMVSSDFPNLLHIWEFHVDWVTPGNSSFTGPIDMEVAPFAMIGSIPQPGTGQTLDSLGDRMMFSLQYRNYGDHEALFINQAVATAESAGVRWYEIRDPGGSPYVYQQSTYAPDEHYRWMGSIAADQDGNLALGYSVSSSSLYPAVRYTGRLNGEVLDQMTQGEASLIEGTGSQTGVGRWGDYSAMTVDPVDDCTFWYTQMYMVSTGGAWYTRIGSFKFPSCGLPKGWVHGVVYDSVNLTPIPGVQVVGVGSSIALTMTVETDANGAFTMTLPAGSYDLTAGPFLPGYPVPATAVANVTVGNTTNVDMYLDPMPNLVAGPTQVDDNVPGGNGNGYPEPGESSMNLLIALSDTGAITATTVSAHLVSLTPGVTVETADAGYPDIGMGTAQYNLTPFVFSVDQSVPCGTPMDFEEQVTTDQGSFTVPVRIYARVPQPRTSYFFDNMENGQGGWSHGGPQDLWAITTENSHSPTHAWSDSPNGNYRDYGNSWLQSPTFDLSMQTGFMLSYWHRYWLEQGWDFGNVEYSTDDGATWEAFPVQYTGSSGNVYVQEILDASMFDGQPSVAFRFRLETDTNTNFDGWHIDDVDLTYEPYACYYGQMPGVPVLTSPADGTVTITHDLTLTWVPGDTVPVDYYQVDVDGTVVTTTLLAEPVVLAAGVHTWTVSACGEYGCSAYATPWTVEVVDAPGVPVQLAPADGAITTSHSLVLEWEAGSGGMPDWYNVDLNGALYTTTDTFLAVDVVAGDYSWYMRACNMAGCSGDTPYWTFTVLDAPLTPTLVAPADGAFITTTHEIAFSWLPAGSGSPADSYNLEVNGAVYTTTGTVYTLTLPVGAFSWRVQAVNVAGASGYTEFWSGEIIDPAGVPTLLTPADGTVTTTTVLTFTWEAGTGGAVDWYNVELDGTVITTTGTSMTATLAVGTHTWRVRAYNAAGYTAYTEAWTVTVEEEVTMYTVFLPVIMK